MAKAVVVNPANPVEDLTLQQARDIFGGKVFRWSEVKTAGKAAGRDRPIRVIARFHCPERPGHWRVPAGQRGPVQPEGQRGAHDLRHSRGARSADSVGWEAPGDARVLPRPRPGQPSLSTATRHSTRPPWPPAPIRSIERTTSPPGRARAWRTVTRRGSSNTCCGKPGGSKRVTVSRSGPAPRGRLEIPRRRADRRAEVAWCSGVCR